MTGATVGDTLARGGALGRANFQAAMQFTGGTLTKALALHMAAVLPTMSGHMITMDDQYEEDITTTRIPVIEGFSLVPEAPGLGVDVDEAAITRFAARKPAESNTRHMGVFTLPGGRKVYQAAHRAATSNLFGKEEHGIRGIRFELWEDDGSPEFDAAHARVKREGRFIE